MAVRTQSFALDHAVSARRARAGPHRRARGVGAMTTQANVQIRWRNAPPGSSRRVTSRALRRRPPSPGPGEPLCPRSCSRSIWRTAPGCRPALTGAAQAGEVMAAAPCAKSLTGDTPLAAGNVVLGERAGRSTRCCQPRRLHRAVPRPAHPPYRSTWPHRAYRALLRLREVGRPPKGETFVVPAARAQREPSPASSADRGRPRRRCNGLGREELPAPRRSSGSTRRSTAAARHDAGPPHMPRRHRRLLRERRRAACSRRCCR